MSYAKVRGLLVPAEHISVSQVKLYQTCPMAHCFKYQKRVKEKRRFTLVRGKVLHEVAETDYAYKIETGGNLSMETKEETYRRRIVEELSAGEPVEDVPPDLEKDTKLVVEAMERFDEDIAQKVVPLEVEKLIVYENPEFAYPVVLFIDLTAISPESGQKIIADSKFTSSRSLLTVMNPSTDLQLGMYALAEGTDNVEIHKVTLDKPSASRIAGCVSQGFKDHVVDVFSRTSKAIKAGIYTYRNPGVFPCTPKACGFWEMCQGKARA